MKGARSLMNETVSESGEGSGLGTVASFCKREELVKFTYQWFKHVTYLDLALHFLRSIGGRRKASLDG
jgi:hypothetical protein